MLSDDWALLIVICGGVVAALGCRRCPRETLELAASVPLSEAPLDTPPPAVDVIPDAKASPPGKDPCRADVLLLADAASFASGDAWPTLEVEACTPAARTDGRRLIEPLLNLGHANWS